MWTRKERTLLQGEKIKKIQQKNVNSKRKNTCLVTISRHGRSTYCKLRNGSFANGNFKHSLVPILQSFRLWDFLRRWVRVKNVVITFTRRARPDVTKRVSARDDNQIQWSERKTWKNCDQGETLEWIDLTELSFTFLWTETKLCDSCFNCSSHSYDKPLP